jgi:hypothetical protein
MESLPNYLLSHIHSFLSTRDLIFLSHTNHHLHHLCRPQVVSHFRRDFLEHLINHIGWHKHMRFYEDATSSSDGKIWIAGSMVWSCLLETDVSWEIADVDLFSTIPHPTWSSIERWTPDDRGELTLYHPFVIQRTTGWFDRWNYRTRHRQFHVDYIQVDALEAQTPESLVGYMDIQGCQCAFNGRTLYIPDMYRTLNGITTARVHQKVLEVTPRPDTCKCVLKERIQKYKERGIFIIDQRIIDLIHHHLLPTDLLRVLFKEYLGEDTI